MDKIKKHRSILQLFRVIIKSVLNKAYMEGVNLSSVIINDITISNIMNKFKELNDVEAYFGKLPDVVEEPNMLFLIPKIVVQRGKSLNKIFSYEMRCF